MSTQGTAAERRLDVLRAIVEDHVTTREPVGSKMLAERHRLGVSPATIRNDMAVLEDEGLIAQPHTSAGRVPTDKGYRLFVDRLAEVRQLSQPERRAITTFLDEAVDLDDVIVRAARLLAHLTQQVAVVQYPSLSRSGLRHLELVPVPGGRLLVVVITDTGRVVQRTIELASDVDEATLALLRARLNAACLGRRLDEIRPVLEELPVLMPEEERPLVREIADLLVQTLGQEPGERIVLAGTSHLARTGMRFEHALRPVLEALEEEVVLLSLLTEMTEDAAEVAVRIGRETAHVGLAETSVVSTGYGGTDAVALLGSIGPTRMDYPQTIAAVRAVSRYLTRIITT